MQPGWMLWLQLAKDYQLLRGVEREVCACMGVVSLASRLLAWSMAWAVGAGSASPGTPPLYTSQKATLRRLSEPPLPPAKMG